jgi:branched-chain amino acid transport system ATP-binding protein
VSLRVTNLCAYYSQIEVCHNIHLDVGRGECLAILGMNGSGKSSLLGAIGGVVSNSGELIVDGVRIERLPARTRARRGIALVPEGRRNLFPELTVEENLSLGVRLAKAGDRDEVRGKLDELFPILRKRRNQPSGLMSGGEQQMLALAVAVARRPSVLLLDEPSQGLAPAVLGDIAEAVKEIKKLGVALLLTEQNGAFASSLADRYAVLHNGVLEAS